MGLVGNGPRAQVEQRQDSLQPCAHRRRSPLRAGLAPHLRATHSATVAARKGAARPPARAQGTARRRPPRAQARVVLLR
eukprot:4936653-Pleurochrysis_carterae.AAC.1